MNNDTFDFARPSRKKSRYSTMRINNNEIDNNNGWNDLIEEDARIIGEKCGGLRWMHNRSTSVFTKRYWIFTGVNIVLSALVITFNMITGASCITDSFDPYKIVSSVLSALAGIIAAYGGVKNYGERAKDHRVFESNTIALFDTIKNQLHLNRRDRQFGKDFIEWIQKEYIDLSSSPDAPTIPDFVKDEYNILIQDLDIAKFNEIEKIDIKNESPERKKDNLSKFETVQSNHRNYRYEKNPQNNYSEHERAGDNYTVTIPSSRVNDGFTAKDKWELSRFYDNK